MSVGTPDSEETVVSNISVDVARAAPDSNPYLLVHWLNSLINGIARRIFDFYGDLNAAELRLMPDTADEDTAPRWGAIYGKSKLPASQSNGNAVATGIAGSIIPAGTSLTSDGTEFTSSSSATIADNSIQILSITRSGTTATVTTVSDHGLASAVPITISGADQAEYNLTDAEITVTGLDTFTYQIAGSPTTPATGTILADFTTASVPVVSAEFGADTNLDADSPMKLQSPIVGVNDTLNADFGAIGGGTDEETTVAFKARYLDRIQNPVAHFNESDIIDKAKEVPGVTRVFVEGAGTEVGSISVSAITRSGNVAKVVTATDHGFDDGQSTSITGAGESEYNVTNARIIVEDSVTFYFVVLGSPATPATGVITAAATISLGQVRTFFMRDNDDNPIPTASEVADVKAAIDEILPANTSTNDNIVSAPIGVDVDFTFTELTPNTSTMKTAVTNNLEQFFEERTTVGLDVDEDLYRAAIANTVDTETGATVESFAISAPIGDISIDSGQIAVLGTATYP
ncbi:MAG: baseplate J/gp47 family protein [candidate division Zixibacteria bacterium]|nr:baseplate J/gp47 family protein [candidate division Zixibacteria bacterium]